MKPLISIIVPIYNVEKYLCECLVSILEQSYENLEIILVNDGSSDKSEKICNAFMQKDSRIKVVNKANGGLSSARNAGLDISTGEFLSFVDSDDIISKDFIVTLFNMLEKDNLKLSAVGFKPFYKSDDLVENSFKTYERVFSDEEYFKNIFLGHDDFRCSVCKILAHKSLFDDVRFPVGELYEDVAIFGEILTKAKSVIMSDERLYFYRMRDGSIVHNFSPKHFDFLKQAEILANIATNTYPNLKPDAKYYLSCVRMSISFDILKSKNSEFDSFLSESSKFIRSNLATIFKAKSQNLRTKVLIVILGISKSLFRSIFKIFNKGGL